MAVDKVGILEVPVSSGGAYSEFSDRTVKGLVDYFAFWIKSAIDTKLADLTPTSADAVPSANRFYWNPDTHFVQNQFPALYAWETTSRLKQFTLIKGAREREISFVYLYDELVAPSGLLKRHGLIPAVDAAVHLACDRGLHPDYGYNGDANNTAIWRSLDLVEMELLETKTGMMAKVPDIDARSNGGSGHTIRSYPALMWSLRVCEVMSRDLTNNGRGPDAEDVLGDATMTLEIDGLDVKSFILPPPDGADHSED